MECPIWLHLRFFQAISPLPKKPMRSDLARWDELPAQSSVTAAEDGPIHNPGTDRPVSDIAAGGLLLTMQLVSLNQNGWDTVFERRALNLTKKKISYSNGGLVQERRGQGQGLQLKIGPPYSIRLFFSFGKMFTIKTPREKSDVRFNHCLGRRGHRCHENKNCLVGGREGAAGVRDSGKAQSWG